MCKIQVFIHGQLLSELLLTPGEVYFAGRSAQSHIILANERGISRQHIRFYFEDNIWYARAVAKFGSLVLDGDCFEKIALRNDLIFSVPPYEFKFVDTQPQQTIASNPVSNVDLKAPEPSTAPTFELESTNAEPMDSTVVGQSPLMAYLKIYNSKTKTEEVLKLEGTNWVSGRHPDCEIVINDSAFSRKHFELSKKTDGYYIQDLESSNGTLINGELQLARVPKKIQSGDIITVKHIELYFELRDVDYANRLNSLVPQNEHTLDNEYDHDEDANDGHFDREGHLEDDHRVLRIPPAKFLGRLQINKVHVIIGILVLVAIIGLLNKTDTSTKNKSESDLTSLKPSTNDLSPDKQKEVIDTFNLAQNYYMQRKFVLCISQIEKLHNAVPFYQNSKELDSLCRQAQELEQIELDRKRREDERTATQNKIRNTVESCRESMTPTTTLADLNSCLQPALELDPQNTMIGDLQAQVTIRESLEQEKKDKKKNYESRVQSGIAAYNKALQQFKSGQLKTALQLYRSFIKGGYPGLEQKNIEAQRAISSIEETIQQKTDEQIQICQSAMDRAELKTAILACEKVLKEDAKNKKALEIRTRAISQLKKDMKFLYDDAALEESLGNIESAKEKWLKIKDTSLPSEDYYQKAQRKLSKYGLGS